MSDIEVIQDMINNTIITSRQKEALQNILEEHEDLQNDYDTLEIEYRDLQENFYNLEDDNDDYKAQLESLKSGILDIELFKSKLELYGFASDALVNFIDDYLKLYNKE